MNACITRETFVFTVFRRVFHSTLKLELCRHACRRRDPIISTCRYGKNMPTTALILLLCFHRGMWSNTTGAFNMLWKWDISIIIIWLWSRQLQMFSKNSGLKVAQINCIRMEIVFGVPQQVLLEKTNFHLGPNSFLLWKNVILCSLQYILTNPTFFMKFVVQYICLR